MFLCERESRRSARRMLSSPTHAPSSCSTTCVGREECFCGDHTEQAGASSTAQRPCSPCSGSSHTNPSTDSHFSLQPQYSRGGGSALCLHSLPLPVVSARLHHGVGGREDADRTAAPGQRRRQKRGGGGWLGGAQVPPQNPTRHPTGKLSYLIQPILNSFLCRGWM